MVHPTLAAEIQRQRREKSADLTKGSSRFISWQTSPGGFVTTAAAGSTYKSDFTHLAAFLENNTRRNGGWTLHRNTRIMRAWQ